MGKKKELPPEVQEEIRTKDFFDMILPSTAKFLSDHYVVGDSYRCVWVIREYPPSTEEQAILSQLAERNGVTLRIYHRLVEPMEQRKMPNVTSLIFMGFLMFGILGGILLLSHIYSLNDIKAKTVGDGQHGTARWATKTQIKKTYQHLLFTPERWRNQVRRGEEATATDGRKLPQGIVVGRLGKAGKTTVIVDTDDVHTLMIGRQE